MKKMKIGNWELEVSKWWLFDKQNWLFRVTPGISFGYMPGYVTLEAKWLFGELSLILSNSEKLKEYFDRISEGPIDEDESGCEGMCHCCDDRKCEKDEILTPEEKDKLIESLRKESACDCNMYRWEVREDGNRYCVNCGANKTNY